MPDFSRTKKRTRRQGTMNNVSFSVDSDTLLILALAYILYRQGADMTVVLGLLSVIIM